MNRLFFLLSVLRSELRSGQFVTFTIVYSFLFLSLALVALNILNFISVSMADYSLSAKLGIYWALYKGSLYTVGLRDLVFLTIAAILFGINMELILKKLRFLRKQGSVKLTFGAGVISLAVSGCASCGLSILSFVGIGGVFAILPFGGVELYLLSILLLLATLLYNVNNLVKACRITPATLKS